MSRWVAVGPERLAGWIDRFAAAHGGVVESTVDPDAVRLTAADGTVAQLVVPFPPLRGSLPGDLVTHALADRRVGVLLVRLGGYAAVPARIDVPDPKLKVLQHAPELYRAVRIRLDD